ncbi:fimbrial protein [Cupriavidus metallidurans]|uniref:fimbrial protein n=1 Tax=Cupriavidus metallidurans TaxID=119219 RepID=UPI001CC9A165|nr:fimbrial protein [Cupriavidus metallidurans]UBM07920.1 type 1 fimbrial protein [Cupriavidus metallidurans]
MKKTIISTLLIAGTALASQLAMATPDGTINITGAVTDTSCTINGQTAPATIAVALPSVSKSTLAAANATAGKTPFQIKLTGCSGSTLNNVHTFFELGSNVNAAGRLTSGVANVDVELLNGDDSSPIVIGAADASQNSHITPISGGAATQGYFAQYKAPTGSAGTGPVATSVTFTLAYQ